jgi:hypothetical protein
MRESVEEGEDFNVDVNIEGLESDKDHGFVRRGAAEQDVEAEEMLVEELPEPEDVDGDAEVPLPLMDDFELDEELPAELAGDEFDIFEEEE